MKVWVDGAMLEDPAQPVVRATDHGLTVGDGVFEAIKVVDGQPFALSRHLRRMARSVAGLGLPPFDESVVRRGVAEVAAALGEPLGKIRITWTAGPSPLGSGRDEMAEPTLIVAGTGMESWPASTSVVTVPWPRNERGALAGLKTTSYAENAVALAEAHRRGASEAVFANTAGILCEGTGANICYVVDGEIRTPTLASGCLAGITRELLIEWVPVREVDEPVEVLASADEVFLVGTTRDVQPVHAVDDRELAAPGPLTAEAVRVWAEREVVDLDP